MAGAERQALGEMSAAEHCLEQLVFGGEDQFLHRLGAGQQQRGLSGGLLDDDDSSASEVENEAKSSFPPAKKAAWVDEEDDTEELVNMKHRFRKDLQKSNTEKNLSVEQLQQRLKEQFQKAMGGTPVWAEIEKKRKRKKDPHSSGDESEEEDELLRRTGNFVSASEALPKGTIQVKKCLDANHERPSETRLTTVQFHPSAQVVMTAGMDQTISLFQVDGKTNPKIQSICLQHFPVYKARFTVDGEQIVATGVRNKMFYMYDMMAGKILPVCGVRGLEERHIRKFEVSPDGSYLLLTGAEGYLHLLSMKTKEWINSMKVNGKAIASTFSPDGSKIYTNSDGGDVYVWDVRSRRCLNRFVDDGSLHGTSIAMSCNSQYLACGSSSGVVNIYSQNSCLQEKNPKPLKAVMNLVTAVTALAFNPNTEILAIASHAADEAVRLVHIPSFNVFSNFPNLRRKHIHMTQSLDFSPRGGFFSVANNKGRAVLYRLNHYKDF
eukprot:gi/632981015/ref/XP_007907358.1/ PREDICTED: U3 small nucleolar RNA-associated protein 18 homolog isoform X1 [Callorhinchus milii]